MKRAASGEKPPGRMLHLIEAAEAAFHAKGYHAATMSDVAKAAGMSKKTVYQLIESKEDLFTRLLAYRQAALIFPPARPGVATREVLIENILCLANFLLSPPQISLIRLIMAEYNNSPDLGRMFHRNRVRQARLRLEDCLRKSSLVTTLAPAQLRELSAMLFGMALGEFHLGALIGFRALPSRAALEQRVGNAVDIMLRGCCAEGK